MACDRRYQVEYMLPDLNKAAATVVFSGNVGTANLNLVSGNSRLSGIVLDPNGSAAHEVRVRLKMGDEFKHTQGLERTVFYADSKGRFEISDLPSGRYRVVVTINGTNSQEFELESDRAEQVIQLR